VGLQRLEPEHIEDITQRLATPKLELDRYLVWDPNPGRHDGKRGDLGTKANRLRHRIGRDLERVEPAR
jgi:hypothetical protein